MITVYGDPISGNCLKVRWTCQRLGIPFTWVDVDVLKRETRTEAFLALNPAGQVPTVVLADGRPLAQSNAIILHLAEGSALIPADPYERARMLEWMFWEQYSHEPYVAVTRFRVQFAGVKREDLDTRLLEGERSAFERLETALTGATYLVGNTISLADITLVGYTRFSQSGGFPLADYPAVSAWVERLEAELPIKEPR